MIVNKMTRRAFLQGAGKTLLAIPFIGMTNECFALAADQRCLISLCMMSGTARPVWFPTTIPEDFTLTGAEYKAALLSNLIARNGQISPIFDDPRWATYNQFLNLYDGLDGSYFTGHSRTGMLAGHWIGDRSSRIPPMNPSIDYIASQNIYTTTPRTRLLSLGVTSGNSWGGSTASFSNASGSVAEIPTQNDPVIAFNSLFNGFVPPDSGGSGPPPDNSQVLAEIRAKRKSVLDFVLEDFNRTIASKQFSASEKAKLEAHADNIRDLENRVTAFEEQTPPSAGCTVRATPNYGMFETREDILLEHATFRENQDLPLAMDIMVDIIVSAIKCGMTQVATLQLDAGNSGLGFLPGVTTDNHDLSHDKDGRGDGGANARSQVKAVQSFYLSKVLDMAEKLNVVDDEASGRTYLDNTLMVGVNEMGCWNHREWSLPAYTITGMNSVNSGHYIDYRTNNLINAPYVSDVLDDGVEWHGRDYNSFLIGAMLAMGLTPPQWERRDASGSFIPGFGSYEYRKDWYAEGTSAKGIITPGRRSAPPFMLTG